MPDETILTKPPQVTWAVTLLWGSLAIGLLNGLVDSNPATKNASFAFLATVMGLTFAIMGLLIYKIGKGRNWARITWLVLLVLGIIPYAFGLMELFNRSVLVGCLSVTQLVMQMVAIQYIFTKPGSYWFRKTE